jgi:hypothetical protein
MVGAVDELLPDRGPVAARDALRAAAEIRVFDGRATAWLVVQRLLEVAGFVLLLGGAFYGGLMTGQWVWVVVGLGVLLFAYEGPVGRRAGAEPRRWPTRWRMALVTAAAVVVLLSAAGALGSWASEANGSASGIGAAVVAVCYLLAPLVRSAWSLRQPRGVTTWPDGAQGYAVLSVLARAQWVHPDRLAVLTALPRDRCDEWVRACAARGLAVAATRGRVLPRRPAITAGGLARLAQWDSELAARAADAQPWTDSTAPTSPDISSPRSPSDVT